MSLHPTSALACRSCLRTALLFSVVMMTACQSYVDPFSGAHKASPRSNDPQSSESGPTVRTEVAATKGEINALSRWVTNSQQAQSQGDMEQAVTLLQEAVKHDPDDCHAYLQLGLLARQQLNFAAAEAYYQSCIEKNPEYAPAHLNLGILYEIYLGKLPQALASYRNYQALNPEKRVDSWIALITRTLAANNRLLAENEQ